VPSQGGNGDRSTGANERDQTAIDVLPDPSSQQRLPVDARGPMSSLPPPGTSFLFGTQEASPLIVPPDRLPPLTSEQVTQVLQVADSKERYAHERAMEDLRQRGQGSRGVRSLAFLATAIVGVFVYFATRADHYDEVLHVLTPIATGVTCFLGGRGYERMTKKNGGHD
jgi:hypothetical protein